MITLVALLRLIPYALAGILAWQKGYKRLSVAIVYVMVLAVTNAVSDLPAEVRGLLASVFALLLGWHAAELTPRNRR